MTSARLSGWGVRLEPLTISHAEVLLRASTDGEIWKLHYTSVPEPNLGSVNSYIEKALAGQLKGECQAYAVMNDAGEILGSTRFYDIDDATPTLAIGYTWYAASAQRTHVNTACKRLLLAYAFEVKHTTSVFFHTSHLNIRSQAAIIRLGAKLDGILRQHMRHKDDSLRDTYVYSILNKEWPDVRERLDGYLAAIGI